MGGLGAAMTRREPVHCVLIPISSSVPCRWVVLEQPQVFGVAAPEELLSHLMALFSLLLAPSLGCAWQQLQKNLLQSSRETRQGIREGKAEEIKPQKYLGQKR